MTRSKKYFLLGVVVFVALLIYASYDIASRTSFPGSKPQLKERIKQRYGQSDSLQIDTTTSNR